MKKFLFTLLFLLCACTPDVRAQRTVVQSDNFDDNTLGAGTVVWTQLNSINAVMGNALGVVLDNHSLEAVVRADGTYTDNQYSKLKITTLPTSGSDNIGVICRASTDTAANRDYYRMIFNGAGPQVTALARVQNATVSSIQSTSATTWAVNDTIEIECDASGAIRGLKNGVVILSGTNTDLTTGKPGISIVNQNAKGDDWEGGDLTAVAVGFPTTAVLDTFTRADGALGANYTADIFGASNLMPTIDTNVVKENVGAADSDAYWAASAFGPDSEVYLTVTNIAFSAVALYLRLANIGAGTLDGYELWVDTTATPDNWGISRVDNGASTLLGSTNLNIANGDSIGFSAYSSTIKIFHKPAAGSWTLLATVTDSTYTAAGNIAFYLADDGSGNGRVDNFGGGGLIVTKSARAYRTIMQ